MAEYSSHLLHLTSRIQTSLGIIARRVKDLRLQEAIGHRAGYDLEGPLFTTLSTLGRDDRSTVTELADRCGMDMSTVSRRVRTLRQRGLIADEPSSDDGRVIYVRLTPEGRQQFEGLSETWRTMLAEVLAGWDAEDVERFMGLFVRFATELESYCVEDLDLRPLNPWPLVFDDELELAPYAPA